MGPFIIFQVLFVSCILPRVTYALPGQDFASAKLSATAVGALQFITSDNGTRYTQRGN